MPLILRGARGGTTRADTIRPSRTIPSRCGLIPDQPIVLTNRGWSFYSKEDYDTAIADFDEALDKDDHCGSAFEGRGAAYREMGEYERAIKDLSNAIRLDPNDPGIYQRRATAYERDGQLEKALADRNRAVDGDA